MTQRHPVVGNTWQMVSLPREVWNNRATEVFSDFNFWLFHWHEGTGEIPGNYINYLNRRLSVGLSYWLKTDSSGILELTNSRFDTTGKCSLLLEEGWNQIANPYGYDILWDDAYFLIEGNTPVTVKASRMRNKPQGIWEWNLDTNNYVRYNPEQEKSVMQTWGGYWVLAEEQTRIYFDPVPYFTMDEDTGRGPAKPAAAGAGQWTVQLTVAQEGVKDPSNFFGLAPDASDATGSEDCPEPPPITPSLSLSFKGNLSQDIRTAGRAAAWSIEVANQKLEPVTLGWYRVAQVPPEYQLWLQDLTAGTWTDLRSTTRYHYTARTGNRQFQLVAVPDPEFHPDQVATELTILAIDPNPFTRHSRVSFYLPGPGLGHTPVMKVYTLRGEEIAFLKGQVCRSYITWDGTGAGDGPGVYFFSVTVGDKQAVGKAVKR
jgi:hypothetical protein